MDGKGTRRRSEANDEVESADTRVCQHYVAISVPPNQKILLTILVVVVVVEDDEDVLDDCVVFENR